MSAIGSHEKEELGYILVQQEPMWSEQGLSYKQYPCSLCNHFHSETTRQPPPHDKDWEAVKYCSHDRLGSPASKRCSSCRVSTTWFLAFLRLRLGGSARAKTNRECYLMAKLVWLPDFIPFKPPRLAAATTKTWSASHAVPFSKQHLRHIIHLSHTNSLTLVTAVVAKDPLGSLTSSVTRLASLSRSTEDMAVDMFFE